MFPFQSKVIFQFFSVFLTPKNLSERLANLNPRNVHALSFKNKSLFYLNLSPYYVYLDISHFLFHYIIKLSRLINDRLNDFHNSLVVWGYITAQFTRDSSRNYLMLSFWYIANFCFSTMERKAHCIWYFPDNNLALNKSPSFCFCFSYIIHILLKLLSYLRRYWSRFHFVPSKRARGISCILCLRVIFWA